MNVSCPCPQKNNFITIFWSISKGCSRKSPGLCNEWQIETAVLSMQANRQKLVQQAFRHGQNCPCTCTLSTAISIYHWLHNQGLFLEQSFEILRKMKLTWKNETFLGLFWCYELKINLTNVKSSPKRYFIPHGQD